MEREELRKKIKQLKYKIEKEETANKDLSLKVQQITKLSA
jgi:cell division protein FtsL